MCELRTHVDFHALNGIKNDETKLSVEHIHVPDKLKCSALPKLIRVVFLMDMPIATEAIVANILKMLNEILTVGNHSPFVHEEVSLLLERKEGLCIFHKQKHPQIDENPPVCIVERPGGLTESILPWEQPSRIINSKIQALF